MLVRNNCVAQLPQYLTIHTRMMMSHHLLDTQLSGIRDVVPLAASFAPQTHQTPNLAIHIDRLTMT